MTRVISFGPIAAMMPDELRKRWPTVCHPDGPETRRAHLRIGPLMTVAIWETGRSWVVLAAGLGARVVWLEMGTGPSAGAA